MNNDLSVFRDPVTGAPLNATEDALVGSGSTRHPVVFGLAAMAWKFFVGSPLKCMLNCDLFIKLKVLLLTMLTVLIMYQRCMQVESQY